ncbi:hypothetical protein Efla_001669 [Eimeria flavescens]
MTTQMREEMLADVKLHIGVDTTPVDKNNQDLSQALLVLTKDALELSERKAQVLESLEWESSPGAAAQAAAILANIGAILRGKTSGESEALKDHVKTKLETEEDVDSAYWEAILQKIPLFEARAICMVCRERIAKKAAELEYQKKCEQAKADAAVSGVTGQRAAASPDTEERQLHQIQKLQEQAKRAARVEVQNPGADGSHAPEWSQVNILHPAEEQEGRMAERQAANHRQRERRLLQFGIDDEKTTEQENEEVIDRTATFEDCVRKEEKNASPDEEVMSDSPEMKVKQHYGCEEKYRPRKPRFFNQIVQEYKFNIFNPDVIDKTKTPTWALAPSDTPDTIIFRFYAGNNLPSFIWRTSTNDYLTTSPSARALSTCPIPRLQLYITPQTHRDAPTSISTPLQEDVAIKTLKRESHVERFWCFRNVLDRGFMQLYFTFKKYCYRR